MFGPAATVLIVALGFLFTGIKVLKEYERGVIFRLGRLVDSRGPGLIYVIPFIERMQKVACTKMVATHLVDGAGHWVQQEQPEAVSGLVVEFLKGSHRG